MSRCMASGSSDGSVGIVTAVPEAGFRDPASVVYGRRIVESGPSLLPGHTVSRRRGKQSVMPAGMM